MNIKSTTIPFEVINDRVGIIAQTENTYLVTEPSEHICNIHNYSEYGLNSLGKLVGFPANFVMSLAESNPALANNIISDRVEKYFTSFENIQKQFYIREFDNQIYGALSNRYAFFDDNAVCDILSKSLGARTKNNMANATINALKQIKTPEHVAKLRGKTVEEILG